MKYFLSMFLGLFSSISLANQINCSNALIDLTVNLNTTKSVTITDFNKDTTTIYNLIDHILIPQGSGALVFQGGSLVIASDSEGKLTGELYVEGDTYFGLSCR